MKLRKLFLVIAVILLVSSMFMMLAQFPQTAKADTNWLSGWTYRKSLVASTGIHVITAHYNTGNDVLGHVYLDGECQTDFDDVRFAGPDGQTLISGVTIRTEVDGDYAEFKVNVDSSPIYVYYGNPAATAYYGDEALGSGSFGDTYQLSQSYVAPAGGQISGIARASPVTGYATSLEAGVSSGSGSTAQMALLLMEIGQDQVDVNITEGRRIVALTETKSIPASSAHIEVFMFDAPVPIFKDTLYGIALWAGEGTTVWYENGTGSGSFFLAGGFSGDLVNHTGALGNYSLGRFLNYEMVDGDEQNVLFRDNADYTRSRSMWHSYYEYNGTIDAESSQGIGGSYAFKSTVFVPDNIGFGELSFLGEVADGNKRFWSGVVRLSALPGLGSHVNLMATLSYPSSNALNGFGVDKTEAGVQWRLSAKSGAGVWSHTLFGEVEAYTDYLVILSYETDGVDATSEAWVTKLSEPNLLLEASPSAILTTTDNGFGNMFFIGAADYPLGNVSATSAFFDEMALTEDFPATFGAWGSKVGTPAGSIVINDDAAFANSTSVTLALTYLDPISGVDEVRYSNDGVWDTEEWETPAATKEWNLTSGDGTKTVYYQIKNTLEIISETYSDDITLDTEAPIGSIAINDDDALTSSTTVTLTLTATDTTSGVAQVRYSNDDVWDTEEWETPAATKEWNLTSGDETKTVYYQIQDNAGNTANYSDDITLDATPPTGTITINDDAVATNSTSVTLTLSSEDIGSGVAQVRYSNDDVWDTEEWETFTTTKTWNLTSGDETKTVYYQIQDNAGNTATFTDTIILDTGLPTGTITINDDAAATNSESVTLSLTYSDPTSGGAEVRYSNDGVWDTEEWETPTATKEWNLTSGDGTKTVYYQVKNWAGVVSETYSDTIVLDAEAPTGSIVINGDEATTTSADVTLTLSAEDTGSGVAEVRYSNDGVWDTETWETPTTTKTWTLTSGDGTKTVYYQIRDAAGNTADYSDDITLSMPTPTPTPSPTPTPTPTVSPSPTPSTSPTPTPGFEPFPLGVEQVMLILGVVLAVVAVGLVVLIRRKRLQKTDGKKETDGEKAEGVKKASKAAKKPR
jgi:hypothetical protein